MAADPYIGTLTFYRRWAVHRGEASTASVERFGGRERGVREAIGECQDLDPGVPDSGTVGE